MYLTILLLIGIKRPRSSTFISDSPKAKHTHYEIQIVLLLSFLRAPNFKVHYND